jgi:hypothetical protein
MKLRKSEQLHDLLRPASRACGWHKIHCVIEFTLQPLASSGKIEVHQRGDTPGSAQMLLKGSCRLFVARVVFLWIALSLRSNRKIVQERRCLLDEIGAFGLPA